MPQSSAPAHPNIVFVFGDQWRAQSTGYAGDPNVRTPHLDRLATESVSVTHAVAGAPVCSPWRASLLTGQRPDRHGVFVNDVQLGTDGVSLARAFAGQGYDTAYVGKWHVDGRGRSNYIPHERRQGFDYWKVLECTHRYNESPYYAGDSDEQKLWEGYDAAAQTRDACQYIADQDGSRPFLLVLSWGPPHNPYDTAPQEFCDLYDPAAIELRPNVPPESAAEARECLAGYYAHCSALDACIGDLGEALRRQEIEENTIFVFTSDHGDMLGSHGQHRKQKPWDESIRVPFLLRYPARFTRAPRPVPALMDACDIMPTLLSLADLPIPDTVDGLDFSGCLAGGPDPSDGAALLACYHPFGEWHRGAGGREFRGIRTVRHTYVRTLQGPWLLYDNESDPYQLENLIERPEHGDLYRQMDEQLKSKLEQVGDEFLTGGEYLARWGYQVDERGTVPYTG